MPELPEVETMVRGIRSTLSGSRLIAVEACPCPCRPILISPRLDEIQVRVSGQQITAVERRAKRVIMELTSGDAFVIEPRMTGLMLLSEPPDTEHLRLHWSVEQRGRRKSVWFWDRRGLGTVRLLTSDERDQLLGPQYLGPDALRITLGEWRDRLGATSRPIKVALLDQKIVAGIGNLYASEILHVSQIHPQRPADKLTRSQIDRMAAAVRDVLEDAIRHEGSTLSDGTYRNALDKAGGYQNAHRVYDREGETCPTCGKSPVVRIVQAQRSTFYCPRCQRPGPRPKSD